MPRKLLQAVQAPCLQLGTTMPQTAPVPDSTEPSQRLVHAPERRPQGGGGQGACLRLSIQHLAGVGYTAGALSVVTVLPAPPGGSGLPPVSLALSPHTPGSLGHSLRHPVTVHSRLWPGRRVSPASFPRSRGGAHTSSLEFSRWDWCFVQASLPRRLRFGWCLPRSPFPTCPRPRPRGPAEPGEDSMSALTTSCFAWSWHFSLTCFATWECNLHSRHQLCHTAASS